MKILFFDVLQEVGSNIEIRMLDELKKEYAVMVPSYLIKGIVRKDMALINSGMIQLFESMMPDINDDEFKFVFPDEEKRKEILKWYKEQLENYRRELKRN